MGFRGRQRQSWKRVVMIVAAGLVVGALLTQLVALALPESAARQFFVTTVTASLGPLSMDLQVIALSVGPVVIRVNVLSAVGVVATAWFARSLL